MKFIKDFQKTISLTIYKMKHNIQYIQAHNALAFYRVWLMSKKDFEKQTKEYRESASSKSLRHFVW